MHTKSRVQSKNIFISESRLKIIANVQKFHRNSLRRIFGNLCVKSTQRKRKNGMLSANNEIVDVSQFTERILY